MCQWPHALSLCTMSTRKSQSTDVYIHHTFPDTIILFPHHTVPMGTSQFQSCNFLWSMISICYLWAGVPMRTSHPYQVYMSTYLLRRLYDQPCPNSECKLTASCFWMLVIMLTYIIQSSLPLPFLYWCFVLTLLPRLCIRYNIVTPLFQDWKPPENDISVCSLAVFQHHLNNYVCN